MARRLFSRKSRRSSNEGDYFTDDELQKIKPHRKLFDPSVLDAILHGTTTIQPAIPQPEPAPAPAHAHASVDLMNSFAMEPIPVSGLSNNVHRTKKHRLSSNNKNNKKNKTNKTKKSNKPKRNSSIQSGLPKPIEQSKLTRRYEWHEGSLINTQTGKVIRSNSFRHGRSGSHQSGRKYNSRVSKRKHRSKLEN
jgi:hypothetical protein